MSFVPNIVFDLRSQSVDVGNILTSVQDVDFPATPGYEVDVFVQITGPTGTIIKAFGSADATISNTNLVLINTTLVPLTSDPSDPYQEGDYKFEFQFVPNDASTIPNQTVSFTLDILNQGKSNCVVKGNLDIIADCNTGQLTATDTTDYKDAEVLSRTITLTYPTIPGVATPSPVVSTSSILAASIYYSNVNYSVSLDVEYQHTYADDVVIVYESIEGVLSKKVICKHNLCKLLECLDSFVTSFALKAGEKGGSKSISTKEFDTFIILFQYLALFQQYSSCGDIESATKYYDLIAETVKCDCGCGKQNVDNPELITPIGNPGGITINYNSPVVVSSGGGVFTISLDASFVSTVFSALQDVTVSNPSDGTFLSVSSPTATTRLISISVDPIKWGSWTTITDALTPAQFNFDIDSTSNPLRYKTNVFFKQLAVEGTFILNGAGLAGLAICLLNVPAVTVLLSTRAGIQIPVFDADGTCVGVIGILGTGLTRNLFFSPNINFVSGRTLNVNGIINYD